MCRKFLFIVLLLSLIPNLTAQEYFQTVKGQVIDKESHAPVVFATVALTNDSYQSGTVTDENGYFRINKVPVGRKTLQVQFMGYESITIPNLDVTTGKELVFNIEMQESIIKLEEIKVKANQDKSKAINSFAPVSARMFTIEESQRYAGSSNDVSKMAMNFAGVKSSHDAVNEIVIRGNSPIGLKFRLEGMDIPNPSHFGDGGATGGPISMLNNNVLANSDFITGAFPAEYSNTISGVFDLKMRNGNNEKHEFLGQVGVNGFELGAEGPVFGNSKASYLVNYRYSTLQVLDALGVDFGVGTAVPDYQDISFKINIPTDNWGTFSLFGVGGKSDMQLIESTRDTSEERQQMIIESDYEMDMYLENYSGAIGLSHSKVLNNSAYTKLILSATTINNLHKQDSVILENRQPFLKYNSDFTRTKYSTHFYLNKKFNNKNTARFGINVESQSFKLTDSIFDSSYDGYRIIKDFSGNDLFYQAYTQYQHRFSDKLSLNLGINGVMQSSSKHYSIEPRASIAWEISKTKTLSFAYGMHSINTPIEILNHKLRLNDGSYSTPNTKLGFTKSQHFVFGYDMLLGSKIRFKSELYYQSIYDAVVEKKTSSYSLLNRDSYSFVTDIDSLENTGTGFNYGLELTLEKFMDRGMYFLTTLSLYNSKYRGSDEVLRNTAFNSNYVFNILGGKEFKLRKKNNARFVKKLTTDVKLNWAGGIRYSPIDIEASRNTGITKYDEANAFTKQLPDYFKIDLRIGYKLIGKNSTQEIAISFNNLTNRKNPFYVKYDIESGDLETINQFGFMPDILYRITF